MSEEGLAGWEYKTAGEKERDVKVAFGTDFIEVEEEKGGEKKMEEEKKEIKEEEEVKEETQAEKKERYIDILVGIGFLKGKDKGDNKERFYYKINDNSAVGRTFDDRNPLGKFWCKEDGEFLKDCKDLESVKQFYAIREGKTTEQKTVSVPEQAAEKNLEELEKNAEEKEKQEVKKEEPKKEIAVREEVEVKPEQVITDAKVKADALREVVEAQHLYQSFHGKQYLMLEAWQILAKFSNLTGKIEWVKTVELWDDHGFEAQAVVTDVNGKVVSVAQSMCMNTEQIWKGKPIFQLKSMCQTRSLSKAYRLCLSYIVTLAGYAASPAEEMVE